MSRTLLFAVALLATLTNTPFMRNHVRASAAEADSAPTDILLAIDVSGSMAHRKRLSRAARIAESWAMSVETRRTLTVELLAVADDVRTCGTFRLGSDANALGRLLDALERLEPRNGGLTVFKNIDANLAELMARRAQPTHAMGLVFVSDGKSDAPADDLNITDLGDDITDLGDIFAIVAGSVPGRNVLHGSGTVYSSRLPRGRCYRLLSGALELSAAEPIEVSMRRRFWGVPEPARVIIAVENLGNLAREVTVAVTAPAGASAHAIPEKVFVAARSKSAIAVEFSAEGPAMGKTTVRALEPGGAVVERRFDTKLAVRSWRKDHALAFAESVAGLAIVLALLLALSRRSWFIVPFGHPDRSFELPSGGEWPLNAADPQFPAGVWLMRLGRRLSVRTDGPAVRIGSATASAGQTLKARLRCPIESGKASLVLDRRPRRHAGRISSQSETVATSGDELV